MKIAINLKDTDGSFGGGNYFIKSLKKHIKENGHSYTHSLKDEDIDIILIVDPRKKHPLKMFSIAEILHYVIFKKQSALVIQRINECDERKKTIYINYFLKLSNLITDHTIFISRWLKDLKVWKNHNNYSIILNGADKNIFYKNLENRDENPTKLKIVTHHWSDNVMKGYDIYKKLDSLLGDVKWKNKIEFTYIGNVNKNYNFKNTKIIKPLNGKNLANELRKHNAYITASINEPAGMHHIEAALCGLPLIYRSSGALPEYCKNYGVELIENDLEKTINNIFKNYSKISRKIKEYSNNDIIMSKHYLNVFKRKIIDKKKYIKKRNKFKLFFLMIIFKVIPL